jgi:hypothetical protein
MGQAEGVMCELLTNSPVATAALDHAGGLKDTPAGRAKSLDDLAWLAEATTPPLHHPAPFVSVFTRTKK